jgi:hypothetical protein
MRELRTAFASAARTASPADAVVDVPPRSQGALILIDVTDLAATPSVVFTINGRVTGTTTDYLLLASAAVTATGTIALQIGPGLPVTANLSASAILPDRIVIDPAHADADSITYSVQVIFV